jgi:hypothetical protein
VTVLEHSFVEGRPSFTSDRKIRRVRKEFKQCHTFVITGVQVKSRTAVGLFDADEVLEDCGVFIAVFGQMVDHRVTLLVRLIEPDPQTGHCFRQIAGHQGAILRGGQEQRRLMKNQYFTGESLRLEQSDTSDKESQSIPCFRD